MTRYQNGHVYEAFGAFHVRFYQNEIDGGRVVRKQRSHRLCAKDRVHYSATCKPVKLLCADFMQKVNTSTATETNMSIAEFWEKRYLPYCEEIVALTGKARYKKATVRGYKQIWKQHLEAHFAKLTLQEYEPYLGSRFLQSLTGTHSKSMLKHIKVCASSLFKRAVIERRIKTNPWHDVEMPDDAIESGRTEHYTLEEAENIISALVDHVDCQLIMSLSCFLGLRRGEVAGLKWEDFDAEQVHIRRAVDRFGDVDVPKTPESVASLPLIDQVRVPLELWRKETMKESGLKVVSGWLFPSRNDTPIDLHNLAARVLRPHIEGGECVRCDKKLKKSGTKWKGLHAGRRGACTAVVEATNGNYAVAQALLRHKSMKTTLDVYKKQITPQAFKDGMRLLEAAVAKK
jgi:integrase